MPAPDGDTDALVHDVLSVARVIAVVGYSANPDRPSHGVARFLKHKGYRVIPVNPGLAGQDALGEKVHASLRDAADALGRARIDVVDVFRRSEQVAALVDEALALDPLPYAVWTQLGVRDDAAAARARAAGVRVVQDRCPAIEMPRLGIAGPS